MTGKECQEWDGSLSQEELAKDSCSPSTAVTQPGSDCREGISKRGEDMGDNAADKASCR